MRVFVTGAAGFIGSHLVEELLLGGHTVTALARYNSSSSIGFLEAVTRQAPKERLEVVLGDVRDGDFMHRALKEVEAVVHMAALIGIPYSYCAPRSYIATNVVGTLNVLEAARAHGLSRAVIISTSEVYGTALYTPIDEQHPLQAQSPYSASKIAADKLAESYSRSFELPVVILRPFNTYGPRQSMPAVIPTILRQLLGGRDQLSIGSLSPRRDFVFVKDTARAIRLGLETPDIEGQLIHFGTGEAVSIGELVELCQRVVGRRATIREEAVRVRPAASEVGVLIADATKARELLEWSATVSLEEGLAVVAEYLKETSSQWLAADQYAV